jgi:hypothetical protein
VSQQSAIMNSQEQSALTCSAWFDRGLHVRVHVHNRSAEDWLLWNVFFEQTGAHPTFNGHLPSRSSAALLYDGQDGALLVQGSNPMPVGYTLYWLPRPYGSLVRAGSQTTYDIDIAAPVFEWKTGNRTPAPMGRQVLLSNGTRWRYWEQAAITKVDVCVQAWHGFHSVRRMDGFPDVINGHEGGLDFALRATAVLPSPAEIYFSRIHDSDYGDMLKTYWPERTDRRCESLPPGWNGPLRPNYVDT